MTDKLKVTEHAYSHSIADLSLMLLQMSRRCDIFNKLHICIHTVTPAYYHIGITIPVSQLFTTGILYRTATRQNSNTPLFSNIKLKLPSDCNSN